MKLKLFSGLLEKINTFALQRNAINLEEKGIITKQEAIAIYEGKVKNQKELYKFRSKLTDGKQKEFIMIKKR